MRVFTGAVKGNKHVLDGDNHRHVAYALRCKVGDRITLCPQDGCDYEGEIEKISSDKTVVRILSVKESTGEPQIKLDLFFGVPNKTDKLDLVTQKATELGVSELQPIMTEYVQGKPQSVRLDRLTRIAEEAAKQCGRGMIPTVNAPISFDEMLDRLGDYELVVFPYESEKERPLKEYLRAFTAEKTPRKVALIIGSEGGFSAGEADRLRSQGIESVTLGGRILRTETACIATAAVLMYELGEWQTK